MQLWKQIPNYPDYSCSIYGEISSDRYNRILKPVINKGYLRVTLSKFGIPYRKLVHQLVMLTFVGECPSGYEIDHINGIKTDNRLENLEYVTRGENEKRAYKNGLKSNKGILAPNAKFNLDQINSIRYLWSTGNYTQQYLADLFNTDQSQISRIVNRKIW